MIDIVNGNILHGNENIIGQQVNCQGVMGAGLAKQIRNVYPKVYEQYISFCKGVDPEKLLGYNLLVTVGEGKYVANLFGQNRYGRYGLYTDYEALKKSLESLAKIAKKDKLSVALPYGLGAGLAGGNWNIIYTIIEDVFKDYEVSLYKY